MTSRQPARSNKVTIDAQVGLDARRAAVEVLHAVLDNHQALDQILGRALNTGWMLDLPPRDRALARAIIAASLRRKGQIDRALNHFLERGLPPKSGRLYTILLSAAAQLLFLKTPPHAAIGLAVTLTRYDGRARRFDKLTNAMLRRLSEQGPALIEAMDAARVNTPDWLWQRWSNIYGEERTRAMAALNLVEPPLDLSMKNDAEGWAERLDGRVLAGGKTVRLIPKGRIDDLAGYEKGAWWVQDFAASLPVRLFGDLSGKRVLDLCAAPGGKTAQLAAAGASVVALDISEARLKLVQDNLARLGLAAEIVTGNAEDWAGETGFDAILLDAPCSSTGTVRRHPDIPYLKSEVDIGALAAQQSRMIDHAASLVRPGGMLVYSTCSLEPEEGEAQIAAFLARNDDFSLDPIADDEVFGHENWLNAGGALRTLPCLFSLETPEWSGMDGFFAARLIARS